MKASTRPILRDAIVIVAALALLAAGIVVGDLITRWSMSGYLISPATAVYVYWLEWGGRVIFPKTGELLSGFVLGRYLCRIRPEYVIAAIGFYGVGVLIVLLSSTNPNRERWIEAVGRGGVIAQGALLIDFRLAAIWLGAWFGKRQRVIVAERRGWPNARIGEPHQEER